MLLAANDENSSPYELETEEADERRTDSDFEAYLAIRGVSGEYRDAKRTVWRDAFKTVAKTNFGDARK